VVASSIGRYSGGACSAAGDLVTNSELLAEALHDAPPDWQKKNFALILHVKVISGAPSSPKVVKHYFW
jgi:hypothetical protein